MTEKVSVPSPLKNRRNPSSRHSMYVIRQDGPELRFADAVKNHDALLTSIYGSRSVDQHLTTATTKADTVSTLGNAGRPRSAAITFSPASTKSSTSNVWQPLFHHTTLVGSAAPLLATFKRDTHVQTENEIRNDVGVQTEEEASAIQPTATYKRDVLVQTCEEWADSTGGDERDVKIRRYSEISPNAFGDACSAAACFSPRGYCTTSEVGEEYPNRTDNSELPVQLLSNKCSLQICDINKNNNFQSPVFSSQEQKLVPNISLIASEKNNYPSAVESDHITLVPVCRSEVYFFPQKAECVCISEDVEFPDLETQIPPEECPPARCFTTYEKITLKEPQSSGRPEKSESGQNFIPETEIIYSRTLSPADKRPVKDNRNSLNMDDYKSDRLSSCSTSERGSMISVLDALYSDSFKFESCENLDQLEEEIIRSLCTPVKELEENTNSTLEDNSMKGTEYTIPYPTQQVSDSPRFFNNMSDQQKAEWHSDTKLYMNCDSLSNEVIQSPVRSKTPTKIDKSGMQARGEIMEKLMKGECLDAGILDDLSGTNLEQSETRSTPAAENEITVDLLSSTLSPPGILEVRRSSWSAVASNVHGSDPAPIIDVSRVQTDQTQASENSTNPRTCSPQLYKPAQELARNSSPKVYNSGIISIEKSETNRPSYWPSQNNDSNVKSEVHIDISASSMTKSTPQSDSSVSVEDPGEKVIPGPPTPPSSIPPPPPPPPPQCYQSPSSNGILVDTAAKRNDTSYPTHSRTPSPGNLGFTPSSQKDLMMQELTERFLKRQKNSTNSCNVRPSQDDGINPNRNNMRNNDYKDSANNVSPHHPHTQKESNSVSNGTNSSFKSVWSSTNGNDYKDLSGKDAVHGSADYKNGIQYSNHSAQETLSEPDIRYHHDQIGSHSPNSPYTGQQNEPHGYSSNDNTKYPSSLPGNTILTDEPPPPGAILVDQKVTVEGDQVHTDKYYAVPVKEVLKEKTSTAKFTPAPPKYQGIGPTEDGVPTGLRQSVKKENMSNWYKTMFKSLHKAGHPHYGGYNSDPEFEREETAIITKCATLGNRQKPNDTGRQTSSRLQQGYPPSAKYTAEVYNNTYPRPIEDYEPGYSSAVDNENTIGSRRFLPALNHPKPSYEFKSGYESDTSIIRKLQQPESPHPEQQKLWYREIQKGGDIPQYGLGKPAPEKPKEPVIGPAPSPSFQGSPVKPNYPQAVRPHTPPPEYINNNDSRAADVSNGNYSVQMQHAIHAELQRRMSPPSQQTSAGYRTSPKSPSKSPELKMFAKVLYDFASESPRELNLKKDELVLILKQLDKNWYEGERKGAIGIFPVSYVEILPPEHVSPQAKQLMEGLGKAVYDFRAQTSVELPLKKGDTISLIRRVDQNWYEGRIKDRKGIFPATYIQVVQEPGESGRSSLSPTPKTVDSPQSLKVQDDCVKKSPVNCPTVPYSNSNTAVSVSNSPSISGRMKKGSSLVEPVLYRALYGYNPQNADELELLEGDNVYVVEMCDDGWFVGTSVRTGVFGIFPGNYVEKV